MYVENEYKCANCEEHEDTGSSWQIYCKYYGTYYDKTETCSHQRRIKKSEGTGLGCYITTITCNILGLDDNCGVLTSMRKLRNDYMQKDPKYKDMLFEYDTVGPKIARCLDEEFGGKEPDELIIAYYNFYLQPTARLVEENRYEEAVIRYKEMTDSLKEYYGIREDSIAPNDYDYSQGGHGKVKKLGTYPVNN